MMNFPADSAVKRIDPTGVRRRAAQRGIAAVEFALLLPVLVILLAFPIFFGRLFLHYSVAQKAAHDAARYMSSIPLVEMSDQTRVFAAEAIARQIITTETAQLNPGSGSHILVGVLCDGDVCGYGVPKLVTVTVSMHMFDDYFNDFTWEAVGPSGVGLKANVTVAYVGN